jgi:L-ascorbate metabolism protein UlaG (beta-lactamase superfamily)
MQLQLIRSATLRLTLAGTTFLIDPWLAAKAEGRSYAGKMRSPLVDLPMTPSAVVDGIQAVLISHLHSDHFDETAARFLPPNIPVITHVRYVGQLRSHGLTNILGADDRYDFGPVEIKLTGGQHGPASVLEEMGPVSGFLLRAPNEPTIYWVGDSILCDEVREVIRLESPDVVVVHGCGATWGGVGPLVMDSAMVLETLYLSGRAIIVATHMDSVDHATVSRSDLRYAFRNDPAVQDRLIIPSDGEVLEFFTIA